MSLAQGEPERNPAPSDAVTLGDRLRGMFEVVTRGLARLDDIACCVPVHRGAGRNQECRHGDRLPGDPELQRKPNARRHSWMSQETANPWFLSLADELRATTAGIGEITDDTLAPFGLVGPRFVEGAKTWASAAHAARDVVRSVREAVAAAEAAAARRQAPSPSTYSRKEYEKGQDEALDRFEAIAKSDEMRAAAEEERKRIRSERFNIDWDEAILVERDYAVERKHFKRTLTDEERQRQAVEGAAAELARRRRDELLYALAALCRGHPVDLRRRISAELAVEIEKLRVTANGVHGGGARVEAAPGATHSEDFATVNWFGVKYHFNPTQARCIGLLWAEWKKGDLGLNQSTIGDKIETASDNFRLAHSFRDHPAWGTLIQKEAEGVFRLATPKT